MVEFREEVRSYYKHYYDKNDEAHKIDHADDVCNNALDINERLNLKIDKKEIILAAYIHDIFTGEDRKLHNKLAHDYVLLNTDDIFLKELDQITRNRIAIAVYEHRSSLQIVNFSGELAELIATADKGRLILTEMICRSYKYHYREGKKVNEIYQSIVEHLHEKFGSNGYIEYPKLYMRAYGNDVRNLQKDVDRIDKYKVRDIIKEHCKE